MKSPNVIFLFPSEIARLPEDQRLEACRSQDGRDSLAFRMSAETPLTEDEKRAIMVVVTYGCRQDTKRAIADFLDRVGKDRMRNISQYERLKLENGACQYFAGQDYPAELASLRKEMMKG